ncbi:hypothetical protein BD311DRAFT_682162 [Dichomitus squalens]|uniref:25S rRNA (uridine-N(3))-methyltransferase BMT5-like domain-containing protein n=1 Tax=Dichomitus squalens TaxID=114155 RepID=A0A4Q9N1N4_9APHY|nr:hypothetical protein BD311DRAFT_682162 [Dichomitus squalens]
MPKGGKKTSLKAALSSQQSRLKKKQEAARAAQHAERAKSGPQSKGKGKATAPSQARPTIPFGPTDSILLVGEGNFSFARALVISPPESLQYLPPSNVTATAYDTEEECCSKYPDAAEIIGALREKGVELLFSVDATKLDKCPPLRGRKFDRIVWNFPHAGKGITDQDRNILSNQVLLLGFLRSAAPFLASGPIPVVHKPRKQKRGSDDEDSGDDQENADTSNIDTARKARGTILVTLRNVVPYTLWDLPRLAKTPPPSTSTSTGQKSNPKYIQLRSFVFHRSIWTGYEHRMTKGERAHGQGKTGEGGEDRTWEFCLQD